MGLPNTGKTTIFNALTGSRGLVASYPFSTVEPNTGVVAVPDPRLERLAAIYRSRKVTPTTVTFVDVAGLVRGASRGEGLGNQFLGYLRTTDALALVARCFFDANVPHVDAVLDPVRDTETVLLELVLADLETVTTRQGNVERLLQLGKFQEPALRDLLVRVRRQLEEGGPARQLSLNTEERRMVAELQLLTLKPMLYVANVEEAALPAPPDAPAGPLAAHAAAQGAVMVAIAGKLEAELAELDPPDAQAYRDSLGLREPGTDAVIRAAYRLLGLVTYFTGNDSELRAWAIPEGFSTLAAAGKVHTDFQRGFIRAEVLGSTDLLAVGTVAAAREQGKVRLEGRDYLVRDGDILQFRFNV